MTELDRARLGIIGCSIRLPCTAERQGANQAASAQSSERTNAARLLPGRKQTYR
jgi:hypothetical protein